MKRADLHELPDDVDALKAMIVAARAKVDSAEQRHQALEAEIADHEAEIVQMKADKAADADRIGRLESIIGFDDVDRFALQILDAIETQASRPKILWFYNHGCGSIPI